MGRVGNLGGVLLNAILLDGFELLEIIPENGSLNLVWK
jgi:hypothetical protein